MMDDLRTRAQLVDFDHAGAIGTVVTRTEIAEAAAGTEFPASLLLDLERIGDEATAMVAVDWDQEALEQLLASTQDDEIGLWFDEGELAMAFDEVEGHGIRQRAAVLTLAVAAAGATSAPAFARMAPEPGGGGNVASVSQPDPAADKAAAVAGAERALQQNQQLSQATVTSSSGGSGLSTGELAGAIAGGALLISAAGFGVARKRTPPPALPA
jgi:hypothetical protein